MITRGTRRSIQPPGSLLVNGTNPEFIPKNADLESLRGGKGVENIELIGPSSEVPKPLILIICTANACRSQMAEFLLREAVGDAFEVASAGCSPAGYVHAGAIEAMAERGFDLSQARSQDMNEFLAREVQIVITVCDRADQACPVYPGQKKRHHWPFRDPAAVIGTEEMIKKAFRRARDEMAAVFSAYGQGLADAAAIA